MNVPPLDLSSAPDTLFAFGDYRLQPDGVLLRGDTPVHLPPKEAVALRIFLAHAGQIVTPAQLRQKLWGPVHVTADSVLHCISSLRSHLGSDDCIQTVYKRGYRWTGPVRRVEALPDAGLPRLAIIPFAYAPGVPGDPGESIAEDVTASLAAAASRLVRVVARDSIFALARKDLTAQQIGESLHADFVLAGTLRPLHTHYRVRAEMVRVSDGTQIWVEEMLLRSDSPPDLPSLLASRIAYRLGRQLASPQSDKAAASVPKIPEVNR